MYFRFTLNNELDRKLIERIKAKAGKGSPSEALKFLVRYWFELEQKGGVPQSDDKYLSDMDLTGLDEALDNL